MADKQFYVDRAKGSRAACKGCKGKCMNNELRIAKMVPSPYGDNQTMKSWYHVNCLMEAFMKQKPTTKRINSISCLENWTNLNDADQRFLLETINKMEKEYFDKHSGKYPLIILKNENYTAIEEGISADSNLISTDFYEQDNKFEQFIHICEKIAKVDAYTAKTAILNQFFLQGSNNKGFKGDLNMWCCLLLPQAVKRVYNLKSKQLVKLFAKMFETDQDDMLDHLSYGDVALTIEMFFQNSKRFNPCENSTLTLQEVNEFLETLSTLTREEEQMNHFKKVIPKCTNSDLRMVIRLIKGDLRINAGPKHILEAVHPDAYSIFQTARDINFTIERVLPSSSKIKSNELFQSSVQAKLILMTPVLPMLAEACKSVDIAMKKCPNGMISEIKYDGERVQVHKQGNEFKYFSRALKPVMPHKVSHLKGYLHLAFPKGEDLVLDAEVLMVDVKSGKPLPFGTLGIHKQSQFQDAQVCLFVFDCLYYNGMVLLDKPIKERRKFLLDNMIEIKNHIMISEQQFIQKRQDLATMIAKVLQLGLEGLVLKDIESTYEPGKRHWLKVKKDYLFDGAMADSADLVVLGAWYGTGKKGGMMSVFLMGCFDERRERWVTVTKVHTGHDDKTLSDLQIELSDLMTKISQDHSKVPLWLDCNKGLTPDFIAKDPRKMPVWEITGTEFSKANIHTADGISVRFPRVTRIRSDKNKGSATSLQELKKLYSTSKEKTDVSLLNQIARSSTSKETEIAHSSAETSKTEKTTPSKSKKIQEYFVGKTKTKREFDRPTNEKESPHKKLKTSPQLECGKDKTDNKKSRKIRKTPRKPLPNIFENLRLAFYPDYISYPEHERRHLERHWIGYGGIIAKQRNNFNVDYVVHVKPSFNSNELFHFPSNTAIAHVTGSWLIECINKRALSSTKNFKVRLQT